jgi:hypothetical protein
LIGRSSKIPDIWNNLLIGVAAGAFGAHALKGILMPSSRYSILQPEQCIMPWDFV